jgi:F-type H+-transporting ATPase subunit gamma
MQNFLVDSGAAQVRATKRSPFVLAMAGCLLIGASFALYDNAVPQTGYADPTVAMAMDVVNAMSMAGASMHGGEVDVSAELEGMEQCAGVDADRAAVLGSNDAEDVAELAAMEQEVLASQMPAPEMATGSVMSLFAPKAAAFQVTPSFRAGAKPAVAPATAVAPRTADPQMAANIRELRDRVGSVKNTKKITSAMKLVAAAKVRRAQEAVLRSRPFSETLERILGGLLERVKTEKLDIPLLESRDVKTVGLIVITGDRGLCGGYNAQAIKLAEARIAELKAQGVGAELILVGNKGGTYYKRRETPIRRSQACTQAPTAQQSASIAQDVLSSFYAGELDRVELIYTQFNSMIAFTPTLRTLIPLLPSGMEMEGDEMFKLVSKGGDFAVEKETIPAAAPAQFVPDMIFEQEPSQLLNAILPLYINGQLLRTQQESVASELASRMSAMQSATDNAKDLQGRLESEMNRARQAKITQELMEIIAGADATR